MGKCAGNLIIFSAMFMSLCWVLLIALPVGWHVKATVIWNFDVGLYHVKVERGLGGSILHGVGFLVDGMASKVSSKSTRFMQEGLSKITEGSQSLRYFRDMFCSAAQLPLVQANCMPWDHMLYGSWIMMLLTIISCVLMFTGCGFYWFYWNEEARNTSRKWALGMFITAPIVQLIALGTYTVLTISFGHWLTEYGLSSPRSTYSFVYVIATLVWLFTWSPALIMCTCGGRSELEEIEEELRAQRKDLLKNGETQYDEYGNPLPPQEYDEYGNPMPPPQQQQYDEYGNPMPPPQQQFDEYGNPVPPQGQGYPQDPSYSQQQGYPQQQAYPQQGQAAYDPYAQGGPPQQQQYQQY